MVSNAGNILSPALNKQLVALQKTARGIDASQLQLATGKRVNNITDNAQSFFASFSLTSQASDYNRLLDGISQSIRTIQQTENGLRGLDQLVRRAEVEAQSALSEISKLNQARGSVSDIILADNPDMYLQLNEESGSTAVNSGTGGNPLRGIYQAGVGQDAGNLYYSDTATSAFFDGVNDRVRLQNRPEINTNGAGYPEKTIELFFNAEDVNDGRQVLYEQGGTGNALSIYLDNGRVYTTVRDAGDFGPFDISAKVESGKSYHVALTLDAPNSTFTGYLNGEAIGTGEVTRPLSRHGGRGAIGRNEGGTVFHDGPNGGNGEYYRGRISDVASYNQVISQEGLKERFDASLIKETEEAQAAIQKLLEPINPLLEDISYRGVSLLSGDSLRTDFTIDGKSNLVSEGRNFSLESAGIGNLDFSRPSSFKSDVNSISKFASDIRDYNSSLASDLNIIETRQNFTEKTINTLKSGSDDLVLADQNEVGAELLSLQVRQEIQVNTLSFAASQQQGLADLLFSAPGGTA